MCGKDDAFFFLPCMKEKKKHLNIAHKVLLDISKVKAEVEKEKVLTFAAEK